jgi:putative hemolysin
MGDFLVAVAAAGKIPVTLREIGRLRELTFRGVGEGTGHPCDLDSFDADYLHLFAWNRAARQVVGAYRMGLTDQIVARSGVAGLYTRTLFRYSHALLARIGPAIELGRSFVRPEYQRDYAPLLLLWRGIARFIATRPAYRMLLGPVSISNEYHSLSKMLLMRFCQANGAGDDLRRLVVPRHPPRLRGFRHVERELLATAVDNAEDVDELVAEIEADRAAMPVLLRQYLRLNARLLAFNVDPDFGDVLDGLMLADLTQVDRPMLVRYMGRDAADGFLRHWGLSPTPEMTPAPVRGKRTPDAASQR